MKATGLVQMEETESSDRYNATFMIKLKSEFDWFLSDEFMELKEGGRKKNTPHTADTILISITNNDHVRGGENSFYPTHDIKEDSLTKVEYPPKCYHCNTSDFSSKEHYESHGIRHHIGLTLYPGPADLEKLGLIPQGMSWEQEIPRDQYYEFELESKK